MFFFFQERNSLKIFVNQEKGVEGEALSSHIMSKERGTSVKEVEIDNNGWEQ